jgi:hypothetical protein
MYERSRRNDRDSLKGIEHEQIGVAGDDKVSIAVYCKLEKLVVVKIVTSSAFSSIFARSSR